MICELPDCDNDDGTHDIHSVHHRPSEMDMMMCEDCAREWDVEIKDTVPKASA